ncbi:MAG: hypothetical protein ACYSVY_19150 [Planctomycetota bacterium]|jgi:hypothetical protein
MASIDRDKLGEYLSAYLDGELGEPERAALERLLARDRQARTQLEELRQTVELVRGLPRRAAPASLLDDLTAVAERGQLLGEPSEEPPPHAARWRSARPLLSMAAAVVITVGGGLYVFVSLNQTGEPATGPAERRLAIDAPLPAEPKAGPVESGRVDRDAVAERSGPVTEGLELGEMPVDALAAATGIDSKEHAGRRGGSLETERKAPGPALAEAGWAGEATRSRGAVFAALDTEQLGLLEARLNRTLTWSQKNSVGASQASLVDHQFGNEFNQWIVVAADGSDEVLARSQFAAFAVANGYTDAAVLPAADSVVGDRRAYLEGRPGVNYEAPGGNQILVQLPVSELPALREALSGSDSGRREMELQVGLVVARGEEEISHLLGQMRRPPGEILALAPEPDVIVLGDEEDTYGGVTTFNGPSVRSQTRASGVVISGRDERRDQGETRSKAKREVDRAAGPVPVKAGLAGEKAAELAEEPSKEEGAPEEQPASLGGELKKLADNALRRRSARGEEDTATTRSADDDSEKQATVKPGELVRRSAQRMGRGATFHYGVEPFVTVVIQFATKPLAPAASQPAEAEKTGTDDGA